MEINGDKQESGLGKLMFFFNWIKLKLMALQN